jgi:NAD-dependent dihydropyrimidine dehydrogenase PreA subunit
MWRIIPSIVACVLLAAHFLRTGQWGLVAVCLLAPLLLISRQRWIALAMQCWLLFAAWLWLYTAIKIAMWRVYLDLPWLRMFLILSAIALFSIVAATLFSTDKLLRSRYNKSPDTAGVSVGACILSAALLSFVQIKLTAPMILLERFFAGWAWLEIALLAVYAGWLGGKLAQPRSSALWRRRLWLLFSVVFFVQLILGLSGLERFLQTGELHLPIPALIFGGPIYRGERFFMLFLFLSTILLVGPAWCSYLCYIGVWDQIAAQKLKRPQILPRWRSWIPAANLALIVLVAVILRYLGLGGAIAIGLAAIFGLVGLSLMWFWSRRTGIMTHCTAYCPIGFLATRFGKLNPFRIHILDACNECKACQFACRYNALQIQHIQQRKPGWSCTLCGDCLPYCHTNQIEYRFLGLRAQHARYLFLSLVVALHTTFLGLARI